MASPGLPAGKRLRSGRARTLTAKARQHEQEEEAAIYREDEEGDESDAMEGVLRMTGYPAESLTNGNEYAADSPATANIEMTGTKPLAQRRAISKDHHNATTRNADGKRPGNSVKMLTDLVRSLVKQTKDQRKEQEAKIERLMTEIEFPCHIWTVKVSFQSFILCNLGGKTCQDPDEWAPNMAAVHATSKFALRSKRLEVNRDIMHTA